jgi:hypothetical protein
VPTITGTPAPRDAAMMRSRPASSTASGFSHRTARLPAAHAASTCSAWKLCGLQMATTSTSGSASSA